MRKRKYVQRLQMTQGSERVDNSEHLLIAILVTMFYVWKKKFPLKKCKKPKQNKTKTKTKKYKQTNKQINKPTTTKKQNKTNKKQYTIKKNKQQ